MPRCHSERLAAALAACRCTGVPPPGRPRPGSTDLTPTPSIIPVPTPTDGLTACLPARPRPVVAAPPSPVVRYRLIIPDARRRGPLGTVRPADRPSGRRRPWRVRGGSVTACLASELLSSTSVVVVVVRR